MRKLLLTIVVPFFLSALPALAQEAAPAGPGAAPARQATETLIAEAANAVEDTYSVSPNGLHVAFVEAVGEKQRVVLDGQPQKTFDEVVVETCLFNADGRRLAYDVKEGGGYLMVVDGREGNRYDEVGHAVFSPDGKRFAYAARIAEKWCVVLDGREQKFYDCRAALPSATIVFSRNGGGVAYSAQAGGKECVVAGEAQGKFYDAVSTPAFFADNRRVAYIAGEGNQSFLVWGGAEQKRYAWISGASLALSPEGRRAAFVAQEGNKQFVVLDATEGKRYDTIVAREEEDEGKGGFVTFSADGAREAYVASIADRMLVVCDGQETKQYDSVAAGTVTFSPDGLHIAYAAQSAGQWRVVMDGREGPAFDDEIRSLTFSSDSRRFSYCVADGECFVMVDGKRGAACDSIEVGPVFGPDGRHVAYIAARDAESFAVVDGVEGKHYGTIVTDNGGGITFDSPDTLHYVAVQDDKVYRVTETLR